MKKRVYVITTLVLFLFILFKTDNCFAANVFTDIRLRDANRSNLVIDFYAFSDDVNIYGILGTLDYDTNLLSLTSCTGMDDFNVVYSDNKILVDDYRKHNNFFSFATCTFEVKDSDKSLKSTDIGFKNITYSDYEQTYFMKDATLKLDFSKIFTSSLSKGSINWVQIVHTYLPIILLAVILGIQVIVICFVMKIRNRRKKEAVIIQDTCSNSTATADFLQNNHYDSMPSENLITDKSLEIPPNILENVQNFNSSLSTMELSKEYYDKNQGIKEDTFHFEGGSVKEMTNSLPESSMMNPVPDDNDSVTMESVTEIPKIEASLDDSHFNKEIVVPEVIPAVIDIDSMEKELVKIIPTEESIQEEEIVTIPTDDFMEQAQVITIPEEDSMEENVISIPDEEENLTYSSNPSYSTSQAFQFITGNDTNKF